MKSKLFSLKSIKVSAKGLVSSFITGVTAILFIGLAYFFMSRQMYVLGLIVHLFMFVWYLFFWGWISNKLWKWN